jgi:hypothetical protein
VSGTAGIALRPMNPGDPEAPYFDTLMGSNINPGKGFVKYSVTPTGLSAQFVPSVPTTFADSFTITADGPAPAPTGTPTAAPAVDAPSVSPSTTPAATPGAPAGSAPAAPTTATRTSAAPPPPPHAVPQAEHAATGATTTTATTAGTTNTTANTNSTTAGTTPDRNQTPPTGDHQLNATTASGRRRNPTSTGSPAPLAASATLALIGVATIGRTTRPGRSWPEPMRQDVDAPAGPGHPASVRAVILLRTLLNTVPVARAMGPVRTASPQQAPRPVRDLP